MLNDATCFKAVYIVCGYTDLRSGMDRLENEREDLKIAGCWSHARRRFDEAVKALPKATQKDSRAYLALTMIQAIYREEKQLRGFRQKNERPPPAERQASGGGLFHMGM